MNETLTIEQLVLEELRAAFTRVAEHIGSDSSLDANSVLCAPFALFMAERAVCKAFRQFAAIEKESANTREILTRLAALEGEAGDAILKDRAILSALLGGDNSLALEGEATPAPTKRQQVAERVLHEVNRYYAGKGVDLECPYMNSAAWLRSCAKDLKKDSNWKGSCLVNTLRSMAAVLEEAAREERDA